MLFHLPSPESPTATPRGRQGQGFTEKGYEVRVCVMACLRPHGWQGPAGILAHGVPLGPRGQESSAYPFHRLILQQNHSPVLFTWEVPVAPVLTFLLTSALCSDLGEQTKETKGWRRERVEEGKSGAAPGHLCWPRPCLLQAQRHPMEFYVVTSMF